MTRTRVVGLLRVIMPLAALGLLSGLFLLGRTPEPDATIPYTDVDPQDLAERQVVTQPTYSGVTRNGAALTITGVEATPGAGPGEGRATTVHMSLRAKDGRAADVSAGGAVLDGDTVRMGDGVRMTTADGWVVTAPEFVGEISDGAITADREVNVLAPFGTLTAGNMAFRPVGEAGDHVLDLKGGVRLIYRP